MRKKMNVETSPVSKALVGVALERFSVWKRFMDFGGFVCHYNIFFFMLIIGFIIALTDSRSIFSQDCVGVVENF